MHGHGNVIAGLKSLVYRENLIYLEEISLISWCVFR